MQISEDDLEQKKEVAANFSKSGHDLLKQLEDKISIWLRMKQVV